MSSGIRGDRGYTHLAHDLEHTLAQALNHVRDGLFRGDVLNDATAHQELCCFHGQIRIDSGGTKTNQKCDVVHLSNVATFDHQSHLHALVTANQVMMHRGEHQQRRNGGKFCIRVTVAQDHKPSARFHSGIGLGTQLIQALHQGSFAVINSVEATELHRRRCSRIQRKVFDLGQLVVINNRELHRHLGRVGWCCGEKVALRPQATRHRGDDFFPDGIQRRVRYLGKLLGEVIKEQARTIRNSSNRGIGTHSAERFSTVLSHGSQQHTNLFLGITKGPLSTSH